MASLHAGSTGLRANYVVVKDWFVKYWQWLYIIGLLALTLYLSLRDFFSYQFGYTPDSVEYTMLAQALLKGPIFALNYSTIVPEATHYPFGYPILLIPFVLLAPRAFELPAVLSLGATLVSVAILFFGWRVLVPEVNTRWRYPVCAMFAIAPTTIMATRVVLSEAVFTTFLLLACWFAARLARQPARRGLWVAFGVALFFLIYTRSIGLVSLGAMVLYLGVALRKQAVRGLAVAGATLVLLTSVVLVVTPVQVEDLLPSDYLRWYVVLGPVRVPDAIAPNLQNRRPSLVEPTPLPAPTDSGMRIDVDYIVAHITMDLRRMLLLTGGGELEAGLAERFGAPWLLFVPGVAALAMVLLGTAKWALMGWKMPQGRISVFLLSGAVYFLVVMIWRGAGERLWYPIQPQLYLAFGLGLMAVGQGARKLLPSGVSLQRAARGVTVGVGVLLALWLGLAVYRDVELRTSVEIWGDLAARGDAVARYLPEDAVVASDWPPYDYIYSGRQMVLSPDTKSPEVLMERLKKDHATALVVAADETFTRFGSTRRGNRVQDAAAALRELVARGELVRVYSDPYPFQIFLVRPEP